MVTFTNLTPATDTVDRTSYTTASVSPTANRLILVSVHSYINTGSTNPPQPIVTGNGITYSLVKEQNVDTSGTDRATMWLFRGMSGSPSSGAITIDFSGVTQSATSWSVNQSSNDVDTTGTNGSGAIVSANTVGATAGSAGTTATVNYAQAIASGNSCFAAYSYQLSTAGGTPRTNWTELSDTAAGVAGHSAEYRETGASGETAASGTFASARWGIVAVEVQAATAATSSTVFRRDPARGLYMR